MCEYLVFPPQMVIQLARVVNIKFERLEGCQGKTDFQTIWLDPSREVLSTLVHELIHIRHPSMSEEDVLLLEGRTVARFTHDEWVELTLVLSAKIRMKGEDQ